MQSLIRFMRLMVFILFMMLLGGCKKNADNPLVNTGTSSLNRITQYDFYINDSLTSNVKFTYSGNLLTEILTNEVIDNQMKPSKKESIEYTAGKISSIKFFNIDNNQLSIDQEYDIKNYEGSMPSEIFYTKQGDVPGSQTWSQTEFRTYFNNLLYEVRRIFYPGYSVYYKVDYSYNIDGMLMEVTDSSSTQLYNKSTCSWEGKLLKEIYTTNSDGSEYQKISYNYSDTFISSTQVEGFFPYGESYQYNSSGILILKETTLNPTAIFKTIYKYEQMQGNYRDVDFITDDSMWQDFPTAI